MNNLRRLDLNLLVTLDALLSEHSVTRAAQRLHFSQPSISVHLAKLRDVFGDPLLLPGPRGMRPTTRADELREPLREALTALERVVSPADEFDPASTNRLWRVAAADYGAAVILQPAIAGLRAAAPNTRLAILQSIPSSLAKLAEQGEIDLALHTIEDAPNGLHRQALFKERYVLVGRVGHPRLKRRPTMSQFCELEHVFVSNDGGGFRGVTDEALAKVGLERRIVLSVPHFLFVTSVLASTDLVAMLPSRLVRDTRLLRVVEPPIDVAGFEMAMFWHERTHRDPGHQWLRKQVAHSV
jgi:DNA-binding transcriptional LysR family regulator